MPYLTRLLCLFACAAAVSAASAAPVTLYVAPSGNDQWSGGVPRPTGADGPLATIDAARQRIDSLRDRGRIGRDGAVVEIRAGLYHLTAPLRIGAADDVPGGVTYTAYPGETVVLSGGVDIPSWTAVTDPAILKRLDPAAQGHVVQADLRALGIADFGKMDVRGFTFGIRAAGLELFYDGKAMQLARWPNDGWVTTAFPPGIKDVQASKQTDRFYYDGDRPSRWAGADDAWVHGYWGYDWADDYVRIDHVDPASHLISVAAPQSTYGYLAQHRWYALNLLEELDRPGEWYLDRKSGILYFWPLTNIRQGRASVSVIQSVMQLDHASHVTVRGLTLECCRATGLTITGGDNDRIQDCTVRDTGNAGVAIEGAARSGVSSCRILENGDGGVLLHSGDRPTLTAGNCYVDDTVLDNYSRWCRSYRPGVDITGVGNRVAHCEIAHAPHEAVQLYGNDCVVEYNDIHDVCQETGDAGAFYMGRDWTMRGNVVRYNYFHDIGHTGGLVGYSDTMAVYLDDMASGTLVFGNLFVRASHAVLIGGGRDNTIANNVFVACNPVVTLDGRGLVWASTSLAPGGDWLMDKKLAAVAYDKPPYASRYPELLLGMQGNPDAPHGNSIVSNVIVGPPDWFVRVGEVPNDGATLARNVVAGLDALVDAANGDFRLKPDSPAFSQGFRPLPLDRIGPRRP